MKRCFGAACLLLAGLALFGCGGTTDGERPDPSPPAQTGVTGECRPIEPLSDRPDPGSQFVDCDALDGYEIFLFNDFETLHRPDWYFNNDRTALQDPAPDAQGVPTTPIPGGRCVGAARSADAATLCDAPETPPGECSAPLPESRSALRVRSGLLTNNGGVFGWLSQKLCISEGTTVRDALALADGPPLPPWIIPSPENPEAEQYQDLPIEDACKYTSGPPEVGPCSIGEPPSPPRLGCTPVYDTSTWEGIVFWGRVAPGSETSIRVRASDYLTDDKGCGCNPYSQQNDASDGCDKFGMFPEPLNGDFQARFVPFAEMQQGGWGQASERLVSGSLYEIVFEYGRGAWDLWVDDVGLYRRRP
jgi:hypothetical protein